MTGSWCPLSQVDLPGNVTLPSAKYRRQQKEGKRRTEWKSKAASTEGDEDGEESAVKETSAMESLSR